MNPQDAQALSNQLLDNLKRNESSKIAPTIRKAWLAVRSQNQSSQSSMLMKLHVNGGNTGDEQMYVIDATATNFESNPQQNP